MYTVPNSVARIQPIWGQFPCKTYFLSHSPKENKIKIFIKKWSSLYRLVLPISNLSKEANVFPAGLA